MQSPRGADHTLARSPATMSLAPQFREHLQSNEENEDKNSCLEPSFDTAVELVPYHDQDVREHYRNLDLESMYKSFVSKQDEVKEVLREIFDMLGFYIEDTICSEIVFAAQPIITGYWYTTGTVYLHQHDNDIIVGKFLDFLIVGKIFSSRDLIIHQYHPWGHVLTLWLQLDKRHCALEGYFWRKWKTQQKSQITFQRTPYLYQKALNYASSGDLDRLAELIDEEKFDINMQKPEAQMFTLLHAAVACDQPAVVHFLLKRDVNLTKQDENGESALRLAKRFHFPHLVNLIDSKTKNKLPEHPPERLQTTEKNSAEDSDELSDYSA